MIPNEEELITTLTFTLTPVDGGSPIILIFQDWMVKAVMHPLYLMAFLVLMKFIADPWNY